MSSTSWWSTPTAGDLSHDRVKNENDGDDDQEWRKLEPHPSSSAGNPSGFADVQSRLHTPTADEYLLDPMKYNLDKFKVEEKDGVIVLKYERTVPGATNPMQTPDNTTIPSVAARTRPTSTTQRRLLPALQPLTENTIPGTSAAQTSGGGARPSHLAGPSCLYRPQIEDLLPSKALQTVSHRLDANKDSLLIEHLAPLSQFLVPSDGMTTEQMENAKKEYPYLFSSRPETTKAMLWFMNERSWEESDRKAFDDTQALKLDTIRKLVAGYMESFQPSLPVGSKTVVVSKTVDLLCGLFDKCLEVGQTYPEMLESVLKVNWGNAYTKESPRSARNRWKELERLRAQITGTHESAA